MLFISYWELNPDFDPSKLADLAQTLLSKKLYPVEGVNQLGWYVSTTDFWGISVVEADTEEQMVKNTQVWRMAMPGVFKTIKTSQAMDIVKLLPILVKLKKQLDS